LGSWSVDEIGTYLHDGGNDRTIASGPMREEIEKSISHRTQDDPVAAATYLQSMAASPADQPARLAADDGRFVAGEAIYHVRRSACHGLTGGGIPLLFPRLADNPAVRAPDPVSLIRVVFKGI
jgi:mono/diheme cytochrome c family protein